MQPILAETQTDITSLFRTLEECGHFAPFAAYVDEAFLAARLEPDGASAIDAYLKRRGWQETPRAREYLQGVRDATPSVWEVHATQPGSWLEVRDRLGEGVVVRVTERSASTMLRRYDRFAARIIPVRDTHMLTGGVLMLMHDVADDLEARLHRLAKRGTPTRESVTATCLQTWTVGLVQNLARPMPELQTTDGESLTFGRTRLSCAPGIPASEVVQCLDDAEGQGWQRMGADDEPPGWTWLGDMPLPSHSTILASLRADGPDAFVVETMSKSRMDRVLQSLEGVLGALVTPGLTTYEDAMHALTRRVDRDRPSSEDGVPLPGNTGIDAADAAEMVRQVNDAHYRRTMDDKVPMLGNRTPRECARTKPGRKKLVAWLKYLENSELHRASAQHDAPYDFGWMWRELGVESER